MQTLVQEQVFCSKIDIRNKRVNPAIAVFVNDIMACTKSVVDHQVINFILPATLQISLNK